MKRLCILLLACLPLTGMAEDTRKDNTHPRYLAGAVTYGDDGKVAFSQELNADGKSRDEIYRQMLEWANRRFQSKNGMRSLVSYANPETGDIAATVEEYLVFTSTALSLDRTRIYYQYLIHAGEGTCRMTLTRIRYLYDEHNKGGQKYTAEEWISDEMALNKKQTRLAPVCGKFRRETINLKDDLFEAAARVLQAAPTATAEPAPTVTAATPVSTPALSQPTATAAVPTATPQPAAARPNLTADVVRNGRLTLTAANGECIDLPADSWGGCGELFGKPVVYLLIDNSRIAANALLSQSATYTVTFYPAGQTAPSEQLTCKPLSARPMSADELKAFKASADTSRQYTLYTGEIE